MSTWKIYWRLCVGDTDRIIEEIHNESNWKSVSCLLKRKQFIFSCMIDLILQGQVNAQSWQKHSRATTSMLFLGLYCHVLADKCFLCYSMNTFLKVYMKGNIWIDKYLLGGPLYWLWENCLFLWQ